MINKISFMGKVYYLGNTGFLSKGRQNERAALTKYADEHDCDMAVLDRDGYVNDTGVYTVILAEPNKTTGGNILSKAVFDFQQDSVDKSDLDIKKI